MAISWSFGGTTLSTYGVLRELNDYMDIPERRGENMVIPFRHGRIQAAGARLATTARFVRLQFGLRGRSGRTLHIGRM